MPFIRIETNIDLEERKKSASLAAVSNIVSKATGKSVDYIMARWAPKAPMTMGAEDVPTVYAEVKSVGLTADQAAAISPLTELLTETLGVDKHNVYIEFACGTPDMWGLGGGMLG